jgi:hypothetical protein
LRQGDKKTSHEKIEAVIKPFKLDGEEKLNASGIRG